MKHRRIEWINVRRERLHPQAVLRNCSAVADFILSRDALARLPGTSAALTVADKRTNTRLAIKALAKQASTRSVDVPLNVLRDLKLMYHLCQNILPITHGGTQSGCAHRPRDAIAATGSVRSQGLPRAWLREQR